jgi:hypothetical protein
LVQIFRTIWQSHQTFAAILKTYNCKFGFSNLVEIKSKKRNPLDVESHPWLKMSIIKLDIDILVQGFKEYHHSQWYEVIIITTTTTIIFTIRLTLLITVYYIEYCDSPNLLQFFRSDCPHWSFLKGWLIYWQVTTWLIYWQVMTCSPYFERRHCLSLTFSLSDGKWGNVTTGGKSLVFWRREFCL